MEQRNSKAAGAGQVRAGVVLGGGSGEEGGEGLRGLRQERWVPRFWRWSGQGGVERVLEDGGGAPVTRTKKGRVRVRARTLMMCICIRRQKCGR